VLRSVAVASLVAVAAWLPGVAVGASGPAATHAAPKHHPSLHAGDRLGPGQQLTSTSGAFRLVMRHSGNLVELARDGQSEWSTGTSVRGSSARMLSGGAFLVTAPNGRVLWTARSGGRPADVFRLLMSSTGAVVVRDSNGTPIWSNGIASRCSKALPAKAIVVSIARQHLWACDHAKLVRSTPVTTGAVDLGRITPTGTWHIYSKQREVNLVGPTWDDHVHYWMPYSGPFGMHDATWQKFPEGSAKYRRHGSHGCVHLPLREMKRVYAWAHIGTRVTVEN
jgi:hypothetical protein